MCVYMCWCVHVCVCVHACVFVYMCGCVHVAAHFPAGGESGGEGVRVRDSKMCADDTIQSFCLSVGATGPHCLGSFLLLLIIRDYGSLSLIQRMDHFTAARP